MSTRSNTQSLGIEQTEHLGMRERLIAFYDLYMDGGDPENDNHLFTQVDKEEALAFFDGSHESISREELTLRRIRSLMILEQTKTWARTQKKRFLYKLKHLDIAFDRKNSLQKEFFAGSFHRKYELMQFVLEEENRITSKKLVQIAERESYKAEFFAFYETHSIYFCYEDRISAWNHVISSLEQFRTHKSKINRLKLLLAMLPANLTYARELDDRYQQLLNKHIEDSLRKEQCLVAFRQCTFKYKLERVEALAKTETIEQRQNKMTEKQRANIILYQTLHTNFPHGVTPEEFSQLSPNNQDKVIAKKHATNALEEVLLQELLQLDGVNAEEITLFKQKSLAEKKLHLRTRNHQVQIDQTESVIEKKADTHISVKNIQPQRIFQIAVSELCNEEKRKLHTNKEFVTIIQQKMAEQGVIGNVDTTFVNLVAAQIEHVPKEQCKTKEFLAFLENEVCRTIYVGESRARSHDTTTRTSIQQLSHAA